MNQHYQQRYDRFIASRSGKGTDSHHIIPKSMGGSNDKGNIIKLTRREHFIAHWMLWKATGSSKMFYAFWTMYNTSGSRRGRVYERAREIMAEGLRADRTGKKHTEQTKRKISESGKGIQTGQNNPMWGRSLTQEHRQKVSDSLKGVLVGEKNPMWGKRPWDNPNTNPDFKGLWARSEEWHALWIGSGKPGACKLSKLAGVEFNMTMENIHRMLKSGWVPSEDAGWKDFRSKYPLAIQ